MKLGWRNRVRWHPEQDVGATLEYGCVDALQANAFGLIEAVAEQFGYVFWAAALIGERGPVVARLVSQLKVAQIGHILFDGKVVNSYLRVAVTVKSKLDAVLEWLVGRRIGRAFNKFHSVSPDVD